MFRSIIAFDHWKSNKNDIRQKYIVLHNEYGICRRSIEEKMNELHSYIKRPFNTSKATTHSRHKHFTTVSSNDKSHPTVEGNQFYKARLPTHRKVTNNSDIKIEYSTTILPV